MPKMFRLRLLTVLSKNEMVRIFIIMFSVVGPCVETTSSKVVATAIVVAKCTTTPPVGVLAEPMAASIYARITRSCGLVPLICGRRGTFATRIPLRLVLMNMVPFHSNIAASSFQRINDNKDIPDQRPLGMGLIFIDVDTSVLVLVI